MLAQARLSFFIVLAQVCLFLCGGMHTLMISANYPEMFNYIGLYSAGVDFTHIKMEEIKAYANLDAKLAKLARAIRSSTGSLVATLTV